MPIGPYFTLAPPPGLFHNGTIYQAKNRWYDANLIRFQQDQVKPIGGWQVRNSAAAAFIGAGRCALSWRDNNTPQPNRWIAVGTSSRLYIQDESGTNHDITPIRKTSNPDATANPIATTNGSSVLTITDASHGAGAGDGVIVSGATAFAGLTTGNLNQTFTVLSSPAPTTNTFAVDCGAPANATTSGGGAAVELQYEMTAGRADATQNLGYGGSAYGSGYYGVPASNTTTYDPATVWSLDAFGQYLVGCPDTDGGIYEWQLNTSTHAAVISGAPTGCAGIVVTQEGFLFALGASGDGRRVQWCDQQNLSIWTPSATNQAGDYDLMTTGTLQCGKALPAGALLLTDVDAWTASYLGAPLVYGFQRVGSGCGPISKGAVAVHDSSAVWMGSGPSFWFFDGQSVQPLDCDVLDYLSDMNVNQKSKVSTVLLNGPGEVWWLYPSGASNENDRYVCWAFRESQRLGRNIWTYGQVARTCGSGKGVMPNPLMVGANGLLYEHETGLNFDGAVPYLESGPVEIGSGEYMAEIQRIIPDELQDGNLSCELYGRLWPDGAEFNSGSFSLTSPTEIFFQAREIRVRFTQAVSTSWRLGPNRLELIQGDPL